MKTKTVLLTLVSLLLLTTTGLMPQSTKDLKATQQYLQSLGKQYDLKALKSLDFFKFLDYNSFTNMRGESNGESCKRGYNKRIGTNP